MLLWNGKCYGFSSWQKGSFWDTGMLCGGSRHDPRELLSLFPSLSLPWRCKLLWADCILWDEQRLRSFINISLSPLMWCAYNHVTRERSRIQELCSQQTQLTMLWEVRVAGFKAQAYEQADSFMLWFLELAGSLPTEFWIYWCRNLACMPRILSRINQKIFEGK